jgi:hypothetical protein
MNIHISETEFLKTEIQRLSALVRAQQITIDKLEQALAAPVQEPVAWTNWRELVGARYHRTPGWEMYADKRNPDDVAIYTFPPTQKKPDAFDCGVYLGKGKDHAIKHHVSYQPAPVQERNFCERCDKRLGDSIHTCTPPLKEKT